MDELRVTYVRFPIWKSWSGIPPSYEVWVYNSATGETATDSLDFWPLLTKGNCQHDRFMLPSHRFKDLQVDLKKCVDLYGVLYDFAEHSFDLFSVGRECCNQEKGILAMRLDLYQSFNRLPPHLVGIRPRDPLISASSCEVYVLYDLSEDTLHFVDSLHLNPLDPRFHSHLDCGFVDKEGRNFYYAKGSVALRYEISSGRIDTLQGVSFPVVPANSMDVLGYSDADRQLYLMDSNGIVSARVGGKLNEVITAYAVDSSVFVVGDLDYGTIIGPAGMVCYQYDFAVGKRRKLYTSDDQGEILRVERVEPPQ